MLDKQLLIDKMIKISSFVVGRTKVMKDHVEYSYEDWTKILDMLEDIRKDIYKDMYETEGNKNALEKSSTKKMG